MLAAHMRHDLSDGVSGGGERERKREAYPPSCDIIVRMVEMGGQSGTAALVLHPSLHRVEGAATCSL